MTKARKKAAFETVEPIGARILVRKDDPKRETVSSYLRFTTSFFSYRLIG